MKDCTIKQLHEEGLISTPLKQVLYILGCFTSKDILDMTSDKRKMEKLSHATTLSNEFSQVVAKLQGLKLKVVKESKIKPYTLSKPSEKLSNKKFVNKRFITGDFVENLLTKSSEPIELESVTEQVKIYLPGTNLRSVRTNLGSDPKGRFQIFLNGYVGLTAKTYDSRYIVSCIANKKKQFTEERILEYMNFVEEEHRSPQPHGLDEEERLYRWSQDFKKSTDKETKELRLTFKEFLAEYNQWIYSTFEYTYKRNCDQMKWYVNTNFEFPSAEIEPELCAWFNAQLDGHEKYTDKRKQMFKELLSFLEDYGLHFYLSKSTKGKTAQKEMLKANDVLPVFNTQEDVYIHTFHSLTCKHDSNEVVHKSLLLIAISRLIERGELISNSIYLSDELLNEFADVCMEYMGTASSYNIAYPFFYMEDEPFWTLIPAEGKVYEDIASIETPIYDVIESTISYALMDEKLFKLFTDKDVSDNLVSALVDNLRVPVLT